MKKNINKKTNTRKQGSRVQTKPGNGRQSRQQTLGQLSSAIVPRGGLPSPYPSTWVSKNTITIPLELFSGVNAWATVDFRSNDVRDPFAGGVAANGYSFFSQVYRLFRVTHVEVHFRAVNLETVTPINFYLMFNDTQPSTLITSWAAAIGYSSQGFSSGPMIVGGSNGNNMSQVRTYKVANGDILGNSLNFYAAANYAGTDVAAPTQLLWGAFVAYAYDASVTFADGLAVNVDIIFTTEYSSMRPIL